MGVRFIIGRAGTGKTRRCFDRIVASVRQDPMGKPILWIVPKQATFQAERELTIELGAFARVRVFSFERLGDAVLAECGGTAAPAVTAYGRQMILGWLLRNMQDQLEFFQRVAGKPGLAVKLDATFVELERHGKTPVDLQNVYDQLESPQTALGQKIADLKKIYSAYLNYLGQDRLDPHRRLQEVLLRMEGCRLLNGAHIYIDGFLDYRDYERRMIAGIAKTCAEMEITVLADPASKLFSNPHLLPDDEGLFHRTESAYRQLFFALADENINVDPPVRLTQPLRFGSGVLKQIEQEFFDIGPVFSSDDASDDLTFRECPDRRSEAMAAAQLARDFVKGGHRFRDVLVLCRNIDDYADLLDAAFAEYGIPCFIDRRRRVNHHPLLQLLQASLDIVEHAWPHDAVMTAVKTGLLNLTVDQADELENYVLLHRIRGGAAWKSEDSWLYKLSSALRDEDDPLGPEEENAARSADHLRRTVSGPLAVLETAMQAIPNKFQPSTVEGPEHEAPAQPAQATPRSLTALTVRQRVRAIFDFFESLAIRNTLGQWMTSAENAGDLEQRSEHEQVWNRLTELFDEMVDVLGDQQVSLTDFTDILNAGLASFDLALTPPTVDQVLVGQVDRTRSGSTTATILVGLNEGQFPGVAQEDSILSDAERGELNGQELHIEDDSQRKRADENLLAYIAMTRSSRHLMLLRSITSDDGNETTPSLYWRDLRAFFPEAPLCNPGDGPATIGTEAQLIQHLMTWIRNGAASSKTNENLYDWLRTTCGPADPNAATRTNPNRQTPTSSNIQRTWSALRYDNTAELAGPTAEALFRQPLAMSISQLEAFAACPFKFFLRYGLSLEIRREEDPTAMDLGNVYHKTLERIISTTLREKLDWASIPQGQIDELIRDCTHQVGSHLCEELMMSSARNRHLLGRIADNLQKVAASQQAAARRGEFRPAFAELCFGAGPDSPSVDLTTPNQNHIQLRGKIDRVDINRADGAFSVIDYKTSSHKLDLYQVSSGLSLQLLVYMLVLREYAEKFFGHAMQPAAGLYVELARKLRMVEHPDEAIDPKDPLFPLQNKPRGVISENFMSALDHGWASGTSEVLFAKLNKNGSIPKSGSDLFTASEVDALLRLAKTKIAELADQILAGQIDVQPFKLGTTSACATCDYSSVCRFQPGLNKYHFITHLSREDVLKQITTGDEDAG